MVFEAVTLKHVRKKYQFYFRKFFFKNWFFVSGGHRFRQKAEFSERDARSEHLLDQGRRRDQVLQLEVEDPLETLNTERPQGRKSIQNSGEILLPLFLGLRVVGDVVLERADDSTLEPFNLLWFFQTVTFWKKNKFRF